MVSKIVLHFKPTEKKNNLSTHTLPTEKRGYKQYSLQSTFLRGHRTRQCCSEPIATIAIQIYQGLCPLFKNSLNRQLLKLFITFLLRALQPRLAWFFIEYFVNIASNCVSGDWRQFQRMEHYKKLLLWFKISTQAEGNESKKP